MDRVVVSGGGGGGVVVAAAAAAAAGGGGGGVGDGGRWMEVEWVWEAAARVGAAVGRRDVGG